MLGEKQALKTTSRENHRETMIAERQEDEPRHFSLSPSHSHRRPRDAKKRASSLNGGGGGRSNGDDVVSPPALIEPHPLHPLVLLELQGQLPTPLPPLDSASRLFPHPYLVLVGLSLVVRQNRGYPLPFRARLRSPRQLRLPLQMSLLRRHAPRASHGHGPQLVGPRRYLCLLPSPFLLCPALDFFFSRQLFLLLRSDPRERSAPGRLEVLNLAGSGCLFGFGWLFLKRWFGVGEGAAAITAQEQKSRGCW